MKVSCPHCHNVYDIDQNNIPKSGRTVQCSVCLTAWKVQADEPLLLTQPEPTGEPISDAPQKRTSTRMVHENHRPASQDNQERYAHDVEEPLTDSRSSASPSAAIEAASSADSAETEAENSSTRNESLVSQSNTQSQIKEATQTQAVQTDGEKNDALIMLEIEESSKTFAALASDADISETEIDMPSLDDGDDDLMRRLEALEARVASKRTTIAASVSQNRPAKTSVGSSEIVPQKQDEDEGTTVVPFVFPKFNRMEKPPYTEPPQSKPVGTSKTKAEQESDENIVSQAVERLSESLDIQSDPASEEPSDNLRSDQNAQKESLSENETQINASEQVEKNKSSSEKIRHQGGAKRAEVHSEPRLAEQSDSEVTKLEPNSSKPHEPVLLSQARTANKARSDTQSPSSAEQSGAESRREGSSMDPQAAHELARKELEQKKSAGSQHQPATDPVKNQTNRPLDPLARVDAEPELNKPDTEERIRRHQSSKTEIRPLRSHEIPVRHSENAPQNRVNQDQQSAPNVGAVSNVKKADTHQNPPSAQTSQANISTNNDREQSQTLPAKRDVTKTKTRNWVSSIVTGFIFVLTVVLVLFVIRYLSEPIAKTIPATEPWMSQYEELFDNTQSQILDGYDAVRSQ